MKASKLLGAATIFFVGVSGCAESPVEDSAPPSGSTVVIGTARVPDVPEIEQGRAVAATTFKVLHVVDESETWEQAHAGMTRLIQDAEPVQAWAVEQNAALQMLRTYLLVGKATHEKAEAAAYYTSLLVDNESPEVSTVLDAVQMYGPAWPPQLRMSIASRAADVAEAIVAKRAECREDCTPSDPRVQALIEPGAQRDVATARMARAAQELREIAVR